MKWSREWDPGSPITPPGPESETTGVELDPNTPWYGEGLNFECNQCGTCCTGKPGCIWLTPGEAMGIALHRGLSLEDFSRQNLRTVHGRLSLLERRNGDCILFDSENRVCSIYPHRPTQCRSYPFWPCITESRKTWEEEARLCPGIGGPRRIPDSVIRAYQADWTSRLKP